MNKITAIAGVVIAGTITLSACNTPSTTITPKPAANVIVAPKTTVTPSATATPKTTVTSTPKATNTVKATDTPKPKATVKAANTVKAKATSTPKSSAQIQYEHGVANGYIDPKTGKLISSTTNPDYQYHGDHCLDMPREDRASYGFPIDCNIN